ncbi:dethiobiotin synthase [Gordonia insulae]|uniref:ATP-dependent dethiobiotin synthetase BioD n=1 Tax=Gordonia insulae TaxID=2420509 RepID=A0A3G8JH27_9ACTN|nr:dethiobiotin synthase [Gordonia insulae]AZG43749.1 ATP-dependent dethiobiotin synthetase BioD [Gordonia insulae]
MTARPGRVLAVTGTSTDVGKTIVTAALVAAVAHANLHAAVCKPAQTGVATGEAGDLAVVEALAGPIDTAECVRYPEPLAPDTAARRAAMPALDLDTVTTAVRGLAADHDVTLVEGAGGILVRLAEDLTLLDVAAATDAAVVVVVPAGLGALNHAELTVAAIAARGLRPAGLIIGSWPVEPDLAMVCNRTDLPRLTGVPIVGTIPAGAGALDPAEFRRRAPSWIDPGWLRREFARATPTTATDTSPTASPSSYDRPSQSLEGVLS